MRRAGHRAAMARVARANGGAGGDAGARAAA
jgi:hypothetical protein